MFKIIMHKSRWMITLQSYICHCFLLLLLTSSTISTSAVNDIIYIDVGVILNLDSRIGLVTNASIAISHQDFYSSSTSSSTSIARRRSEIVLHFRNSRGSTFEGASAALDLVFNVKVKSLVSSSDQGEELVAQIANQAGIPLISLSPVISYINPQEHFNYLLGVDLRDSSQAKAISSLVKAQQLKNNINAVTLLHDDSTTDSFIPTLTATFEDDGMTFTRLAINGRDITQILNQLAAMKTGVVVLHVSFSLAVKIFKQAYDTGLTTASAGHHMWILTARVGNLMSFLEPWASPNGIMHAVFAMRNQYWRQNTETNKKLFEQGLIKADNISGMDIYSLWAYDALQILAEAIEKTYQTGKESGQRLMESIILSRNISRKLRPDQRVAMEDAFEIHQIVDMAWRRVGYWNASSSLSFHNSSQNQSTVRRRTRTYMKRIGRRVDRKLEDGLETSEVLNILVPATSHYEFVNQDNTTKKLGGFSIEVFNRAIQNLTCTRNYTTVYKDADNYNRYYDHLIDLVAEGKYDVLVGDVTITANRSMRVDFSQPYMINSDVVMVVQAVDKKDASGPFWFLKPLSNELWGATIAFLALKGILLWVFESPINGSFRAVGKLDHAKNIFYMSFPAFPDSERIESRYSKLMNTLWMLILFMLAAGYNSTLTSMLTVDRLRPKVTDLRALIARNETIGYQRGAFMEHFLLQIGARPQQLRRYSTAEEYATALKNGPAKNGCIAIVDELPYIRVFLKNNPGFIIAGSYYHTGGLGFVFGKGSKWLTRVSEGVLNITQNTAIMCELERKVFAIDSICAPSREKPPMSYTEMTLSSFKYPYLFGVTISVFLLVAFLFQRLFPKAFLERDYDNNSGMVGSELEHARSVYASATDRLSPASATRILTRASTF